MQRHCLRSLSKCFTLNRRKGLLITRKLTTMSTVNLETKLEEGQILKKLFELVNQERCYNRLEESKKVVDFKHPHELQVIFHLRNLSSFESILLCLGIAASIFGFQRISNDR